MLREGAIAAGLTALMILVFLGSWRSTLIVLISIPLSILTSIAVLSALGETINTMTLGGLALAVGILVDDSTVTIENTHRLLDEGAEYEKGILEGAAGIALPTLVSTLAISCVFISVVFLEGAPRYLFTPQGYAVVFAMLASYAISRTLVPIINRFLLRAEYDEHRRENPNPGFFARFNRAFNERFDQFRSFYTWVLDGFIRHRFIVPLIGVLRVWDSGRVGDLRRPRFLPDRRRRPHPAPCARPGPHAHRGHREIFPGRGRPYPRRDPRIRPRPHPRQYRPAAAAL